MEYEVEGARPRGRPKKTWREIVEKDCQAHKLNRTDDQDRCEWMNVSLGTGSPGLSWTEYREP